MVANCFHDFDVGTWFHQSNTPKGNIFEEIRNSTSHEIFHLFNFSGLWHVFIMPILRYLLIWGGHIYNSEPVEVLQIDMFIPVDLAITSVKEHKKFSIQLTIKWLLKQKYW